MTRQIAGRERPRLDSTAKVTGRALYAYDRVLPGMLHTKVLRSPHASARITRIDVEKARALAGVGAVACRDDLGGLDPVYGSFVKDGPILATDRVRYIGEPVVAVAAVDERTALAALELVTVEYEVLPHVSTVEEALADGAPELFPEAPRGTVPDYGAGASGSLRPVPNVSYEFRYRTGSEDVWAEADHIFTDEFTFSRMNHYHLEPFVSVATADVEQIEVWSATQSPFPLRRELARMFVMPENTVRVHVDNLGGGFGAKHGPRCEPIAILLARLSGRPVRYCMTLEECLRTISQHSAVLRLTSGVKADGTFVARKSEVLLNAGAYSDASPLVTEKAGYRAPGPYRWKLIDSVAQAVLTNTVPSGAFRGFGGTQTTWASERQIDLIAQRIGQDPLDLRLQNIKNLGEEYVPGETPFDADLAAGLHLVADAIGYRDRTRIPGRGMGVAIGMKDGGGVNKPARARVRVATSGDVYLESGLVEMGQGSHTALVQLVADTLGCPLERVKYVAVDTDHSPFDQGTNASSGVAVMGTAVLEAATRVREQVLTFMGESLGVESSALSLNNWKVSDGTAEHAVLPMIMREFGGTGFEFSADGYYKPTLTHAAPLEAPCVFWEGGWAAAEVEVDTETGAVEVLQLIVSGDAGVIVNELGARGQEEGAAVQALGQALFEELRFEGPDMINGEALLYRVPLAEDLPAVFRSITQEQGKGAGPWRAKGMGEGTILPVAPAIAAAIADATGAQLTGLPMSPERVLDAIDAAIDAAIDVPRSVV
ncbi:aldehyde oxidase [Rhodococcus sp. 05-340-1]|uniref:xanthine dehydrogenase family protein molybdopterin-binding subunit n=1 Tax=unclassified Rhodococcus (in: high G+C Gram-positive bacteria) TaxID=192944 RepID=UPI000B9AF8F8|nr:MULTISPECIES: xanthine dehydrogenase family protein molybdopterin-binding subunit [unclassified Rhodococcus (in: high G+C Gram-positive bacteria)]OZD68877.1 aldehyde oxidase [Rhodococcus sp. 05-340-2]OZD69350.1 aldehyde oxidase [Rhodococcus sp. 05-340-1]